MPTPAFTFRTDTPEQRAALSALLDKIGDDGHSIYENSVLSDFGREAVAMFAQRRYSGPDGTKEAIEDIKTKETVEAMNGIYGLDVLMTACKQLGLSPETKMGRGAQARACTAVLRAHLASLNGRPQA